MNSSLEKLQRRDALKMALGLSSGLVALTSAGRAFATACEPTPRQMAGPFYPVVDQVDKDADLTFVTGKEGKASGQVVYIHGAVRGSNCRPIAGALVEIWQACESGRYSHPGDNSSATLDPFFQYWGMTTTDQEGRYMFKTIVPGAYGAGGGMRTPHIHYKIRKPGYREFTTQMYFEGEDLNDQDGVLSRLSAAERNQVVVRFGDAPAGFEQGSKIGLFDIRLS